MLYQSHEWYYILHHDITAVSSLSMCVVLLLCHLASTERPRVLKAVKGCALLAS